MYFPPHPIPLPCGERIQATSNQRRATNSWPKGWDSFSPLVLGAHRLAPVATHALFIHRAATVLRSRPPSLSFALLTFPPTEAFGSASNPTFFSLCFFSGDIRHTKYDIRFVAERVGFLLPPRFGCSPPRTRCNSRALYSSRSNCPPKPATLTIIRSAHSSSPGSVRVGFESHQACTSWSIFAIHEILTTRYEFMAERVGFEPTGHLAASS